MIYPVAIHKENGHFFAKVPDLPSLQIDGASMADVIENARLVIIEHLQNLADNNLPINEGQDISVHLDNAEFFGHTWAIISLDSLRLAQTTLSYRLDLPKSMLAAIQNSVGGDGKLAEQFILDAIREKLAKNTG